MQNKERELLFLHMNQLVSIVQESLEIPVSSPSMSALAVALIYKKALNHVFAATLLRQKNHDQEAIILLRSAYEAIIMATYLKQNPSKLPAYEAHGILCNLRNTTEMMLTVENDAEIYVSLAKRVNEIKELYRRDFLQYGNITDTDLDNPLKVKKASNKALFETLTEMLKVISFDENNEWMRESFYIYNIGSQIAHSQLDSIKIELTGESEHVLYSRLAIDRYLMCFLINCSEILQMLGFMKAIHNEALVAHIELGSESLQRLVAMEGEIQNQKC